MGFRHEVRSQRTTDKQITTLVTTILKAYISRYAAKNASLRPRNKAISSKAVDKFNVGG